VIRPLLLVLAVAAWRTATPGALQDQAAPCVSGEPQPVLDAASPMIHSHVFRITGPRTAEESADLEPDLMVHVSRAGCAHFSLLYSFDIAAPAPITDSRAWLRIASEVMRRIAKAETAGFASVLASALEAQERAGAYRFREPITITEGYASAELDVVSHEQGRATVRVSYQVVL
jgi:hypothetical protein